MEEAQQDIPYCGRHHWPRLSRPVHRWNALREVGTYQAGVNSSQEHYGSGSTSLQMTPARLDVLLCELLTHRLADVSVVHRSAFVVADDDVNAGAFAGLLYRLRRLSL